MRKYLIPENGKFYKAAMHIHTNLSDGKLSVEEMKQAYIDKGYSIVAFTDHEKFITHNDLTDENFIAINSTEISISDSCIGYKGGWQYLPTYHLNLYAKRQDITEKTEDMLLYSVKIRDYSQHCINEIIKACNKGGFLVCYNHPVGGLQNYKDYGELKNLWGVEWFNADCAKIGMDESMQAADDLLRLNERVFPIAGDDAHDLGLVGKCFNMIKAEKLEYECIMDALEKGHFYSSTGPEIYELYIEDGLVHIKCSDVRKIALMTERRVSFIKNAEEGTINEAVFDIRKYEEDSNLIEGNYEKAYIRITLTDTKGNLAQSVPYFLTDIKDFI